MADLKNPENALFLGELNSLCLTFYENERPLKALAGIIDWKFQGVFSYFLKAGLITGKQGECVYIPAWKQARLYHFVLLGCGKSNTSAARKPVSLAALEVLKKNLLGLKVQPFGISCSDFGNLSPDTLAEHLKGVPTWILQ